jgi:cell division protein FtsQ
MAQPARKRKKRSALFAPVAFLLVCTALVLALSVFFRVSNVEVEGNARYSEEEIIAASGIEQGDNLFFVNRFAAMSRINAKLPYIETAEINLKMPNRLKITVTESVAVACVGAEDGTWAIDRSCKLLSRLTADELEGLIRIEGLVAIAPDIGETVAPGEAELPKVSYLAAVLRQITELGMQADIRWIDMTNPANPSFDYLGRFTVKLGPNENVEYKFQCLRSAVEALAPGDRGTLDLSIDRQAHLTYD